ncbi:dnaJ homolog subfamily C member 2-like [Octopus vulgaris]|nr:dnaJ homolog subfamily C member 2-like [Octopus vulgaris]
MLLDTGEDDEINILGQVSAPLELLVEPVGRLFEQFQIQLRHKYSHEHFDGKDLDQSESGSSEDELPDDEDETLLFSLDPREWKNQDHYAVLGLKKLRINATANHIKKAYKAKVLKHHPDKRRKLGNIVKDDDYFTCISKAYEILGNPVKRRAYDSVDAEFDNDIPSLSTTSKEKFFEVFEPVFERNSRWSLKKPVPKLGDNSSSFKDVDRFYSFWYDFESWREYSYLDEEEKEKGENREERRWIEKQNKAARQKRKKEEMARIRQLVDNAYACDPRVHKFKEEEKEKKLAQKRARQEAARAKAEEEERIRQEALAEERRKKEAEEEAARQAAAAVKKEKDALRKVLKKEKKILRNIVKENDYFASNESEKVNHMEEVEKLAELLSVTRLQSLNEALNSGDKEVAKKAFLEYVKELKEQMEEEKKKQLEVLQKPSSNEVSQVSKDWTELEMQFMVTGVNLFPAGTRDRWEVIANFIIQHVEGSRKTARDVLKKAKELQKNDFSLKEEAQKKAFEVFEKHHTKGCSSAVPAEGRISQRYESVVEQQMREQGTNPSPWTSDEQKLLEQSLKTYPADVPERWEKIAANIPSRSKKDCIKRYKELVEMVRAKKMAQSAAAKAKRT